eukprot:1151250-Pelagomonas_calceolata.AAC.1
MESWRGSGNILQSLNFTRSSRLAHGLLRLGASVTSQRPPIGDVIVLGSFRVLQTNCVFPILWNETGGHMQGSLSAHQACSSPDPAASII